MAPTDFTTGEQTHLRAPGNYDTDQVSDATGLDCTGDPGHTQQHFKEETDINTIVQRFGLTGELPLTERQPVSGDFTGIHDFQTAINAVRRAQEGFDDLPGPIRARFHNNPAQLLEFLEDPGNKAEALKLGIIQPPPEKTRDAIQAIDDLAAKILPPANKVT